MAPEAVQEQNDVINGFKTELDADNRWLKVKQADLPGFFDVHNQRGVPLEEAKQMIIDNNWSSVTVTPAGHCFFKKFYFELNPYHLKVLKHIDCMWIYNPKGHNLD